MYKLENTSSKARLGSLKTSHKVKAPFFMPVATKAAVRHITMPELKQIGSQAIICNSLLLSLKPGVEFISKMGGLNKFMDHFGITFTDSGGFQVIRRFCLNIDEKGIHFKSPYDGRKHFLDANKAMHNQIMIDSDVAMCLDHMPLAGMKKSEVLYSMNRTYDWAKICKEEHDKLKKKHKSKQLLFGIAQGGVFDDLRERSIKQITSLNFDGYALGGMAIGEPQKEVHRIMKFVDMLPSDKIRYCMGLGHPINILEAVAHGFDCFDSVYPTQTARHNHMLTFKGIVKLNQKQHKEDSKPIDKDCDCFVCKNYSRAYLRYITNVDEPISYQLKSYHNLWFMQRFMEEIQLSIKENRFEKFRKEFVKGFKR